MYGKPAELSVKVDQTLSALLIIFQSRLIKVISKIPEVCHSFINIIRTDTDVSLFSLGMCLIHQFYPVGAETAVDCLPAFSRKETGKDIKKNN